MQTFDYVIKDEIGLHARPAGALVKEAKQYASKITVSVGEKSAEATKLMALMGLCIKSGTKITVTVEGADETVCAPAMQTFFESNL